MFKGAFAWVGYLSLPPRCILAQVEVVLPQKIPANTLIDTDVNDIIFYPISVPYSSKIEAKTINGKIDVNDLAVESLILKSNNGDIKGSVSSIVNELTANTDNGRIQLNVMISSNATNPKVEIITKNGEIRLGFVSMINFILFYVYVIYFFIYYFFFFIRFKNIIYYII